jgi:cell division protein FtsB
MPAPTAPEPPPDSTAAGAAVAGPASPAESASGANQGEADLAAVPAFLRQRAANSASGSARAVIHRPAEMSLPDAASLPMLGLAPRRLILIGLAVVLVWMLASFGRQVTEASAASARADELRAANAALVVEVEALERELQTISDQRYIQQAARAYRLGAAQEIPFALEATAPELAADAPGSASVRVGSDVEARSPIEAWLDVLFGPGD